jgi:hypothetical protein
MRDEIQPMSFNSKSSLWSESLGDSSGKLSKEAAEAALDSPRVLSVVVENIARVRWCGTAAGAIVQSSTDFWFEPYCKASDDDDDNDADECKTPNEDRGHNVDDQADTMIEEEEDRVVVVEEVVMDNIHWGIAKMRPVLVWAKRRISGRFTMDIAAAAAAASKADKWCTSCRFRRLRRRRRPSVVIRGPARVFGGCACDDFDGMLWKQITATSSSLSLSLSLRP